jgi:hypothetical protein
MNRVFGYIQLITFGVVLTACSTHGIVYNDDSHYEQRVTQYTSEDAIVEASALGSDESLQVFGAPLNDVGIQPVWIKITNTSNEAHWFFPIGVDSEYFPAYEVTRRAQRPEGLSEDELYERLVNYQISHFVPPQSTISGFVYTHTDEGMKSFKVELHNPRKVIKHTFVVPVPGLPHDYFELDQDSIYLHHEVSDLDMDGLRRWIETIDCCTRNIEGKQGDPVNVIFVGSLENVRAALITRHWDVTAPVTKSSLWRMAHAFIFGSRYRYAPISELYVLERPHDLAFQKSRAIIDERNHMRLWLAPVKYQGKHVWLAQISRDVGVKFSGRLWPPTTHVIDPDVDEARFYLMQDLLEGESIYQLGYVKGHQVTSVKEPHYNAEDDPYFTDGLRLVLFIADEPVPVRQLKVLDWELPEALEPHRSLFASE